MSIETHLIAAGAFGAIAKQQPTHLQRKAAEYETRYKQWEADKQAFLSQYGQAAWDQKIEAEIEQLYGPETDWRCRTKP